MTEPYLVEHSFLWSDGKLRIRRYDCASYDEADSRMAKCVRESTTTRVVIKKRSSVGRHSSTIKVATKAP